MGETRGIWTILSEQRTFSGKRKRWNHHLFNCVKGITNWVLALGNTAALGFAALWTAIECTIAIRTFIRFACDVSFILPILVHPHLGLISGRCTGQQALVTRFSLSVSAMDSY
eukprot:6483463-Amphidinium_carterae.1